MKPGEKQTSSSSSAQLKDSLAKIQSFFANHFGFMFIVMSLFALIYAAFLVQQQLQNSPLVDESSVSKDYSTNFNKSTIEKINSLGDMAQKPLPNGRTNPFSE